MKNLVYILAFSIVAISCEKKEPEIPNEEEVITTLIYRFTPVGGGEVQTLKFADLDGVGGNDPVYTTGTIKPNTTYMAVLELLNEQETPAEIITNEILEENQEHQFFFNIASELDLTVAYDDTDLDGYPVGVKSKLTTGGVSVGILKITLRHEPDKLASGVSDGDISNAGGETDIEVEFNVTIQ